MDDIIVEFISICLSKCLYIVPPNTPTPGPVSSRSTGHGGSGIVGTGFCGGFTRGRLREDVRKRSLAVLQRMIYLKSLRAAPMEGVLKSKNRFSVTGLMRADRAFRVGLLSPAMGLSSWDMELLRLRRVFR